MSSLLHCSLALFVALFTLGALQQPEITGDWYFDRFGGPHGEVSKGDSIDKATKEWAGYKFVFTKDGRCRTIQQDGARVTKNYEYIPSRGLVIFEKDTMKISLLTAQSLELYPINGKQPALFLKRNKDEKTAMNAP